MSEQIVRYGGDGAMEGVGVCREWRSAVAAAGFLNIHVHMSVSGNPIEECGRFALNNDRSYLANNGKPMWYLYFLVRLRDTRRLSSLPLLFPTIEPQSEFSTAFASLSQPMNREHVMRLDGESDARVQFLATSNTPPLERERIEMSATLAHVRTLIKCLNPKETAQRARLEAFADKLVSVIHPMRSIPPEILCEIFSHLVTDPNITCQGVKDYDFVDSLDTKRGVWALTHVCSRWRQIAASTSSLWTTVGLPFDKHPKSSVTANILATYLQRSNQRALNVIVYSKDDISEQPAMQILMQTSERWRGGWFSLPLATYLAWRTPFPFKKLDKLRVCIQQPAVPFAAFEEGSTAICRAFGDAPNLIDVVVDHKVIFYELFDLDWTTLHRFAEEQRFPDDFIRNYPTSDILSAVIILSEASSLKSAQFNLHEFDRRFEYQWLELMNNYILSHGGIIRNAALSFLVLNGASESWTRMLSQIELPNLQTLHCHPNLEDDSFPAPLSAATGRNLRELVVHVEDRPDTEAVQAFLNMTPELLDLKMIFPKGVSIGQMCKEARRILFEPGSPKLVLRLETLTLTTLLLTKVFTWKRH